MSDRNDGRLADELELDGQLVKAAWAFDEQLNFRRRDNGDVLATEGILKVETLSRLVQAQRTIELLFDAGADAVTASPAGETTADSPAGGQEETLQ